MNCQEFYTLKARATLARENAESALEMYYDQPSQYSELERLCSLLSAAASILRVAENLIDGTVRESVNDDFAAYHQEVYSRLTQERKGNDNG